MDGDKNNGAYDPVVRRRILIVAAVFAAWLLLALGRAWYVAVPCRTRYAAIGEKMARRVFRIPAPRGRILDADGEPLAWSLKFWDLVSAVPRQTLGAEEIASLKRVLPDMTGEGDVLRRGMTLDEANRIRELTNGVRVRIVARTERIVIDSPEIRRRVGKVSVEDGRACGVSGWEREFDRELSGSPGRMSVMVDRTGRWIPSSERLLKPMVPGKDVRLPQTLRELKRCEKGAGDVR